ncbi:uncharacterized protein LOC133782588 isoform X2 [Humulus lupulus]|uniref:uncharacterized protein LOC133782588 isoform X2 n=1 Tax=Humulus lupulus TaxID=3486 RepID=UPI002B4181E8|nr:uncharacterized protein LOC133782588 isoform X2 [Humulus lupulus]
MGRKFKVSDYDPYNPYSLREDQGLDTHLAVEHYFKLAMPIYYVNCDDWRGWRSRALIIIYKYSKCENFDPCVPYLALIYYDHIITVLPPVLLEEHSDIVVVSRKVFQSMELHILRYLDWGIRIVNPLCFLQYWEPKLSPTFCVHRKLLSKIIIQSYSDLMAPACSPSHVAASAFIAASAYFCHQRHLSLRKRLTKEGIITQVFDEAFIYRMIILCQELKLFPKSTDSMVLMAQEEAAENSKEALIEEIMEQLSIAENDIGDDKELNFQLRWTLGVLYEQQFVIFRTEPKFHKLDPAFPSGYF